MDDLYHPKEPLIQQLRLIIRFAVRLLAVLMTLVILWGVLDVAWVLYGRLMDEPFMMLTISDILDTFGAFMAVLIAIEIFINITVYLREDVIHVKIVMATALMAIARKVIILDFSRITPDYIWATAGVVLAMSIGYWLVTKIKDKDIEKATLTAKEPPEEPGSGRKGGEGPIGGSAEGGERKTGILDTVKDGLLGRPSEWD